MNGSTNVKTDLKPFQAGTSLNKRWIIYMLVSSSNIFTGLDSTLMPLYDSD